MQAIAKGIRVSPRKMSTVAALVRERSVEEALTILEHTPRRAAGQLRDVIKSAAANAEHNHKHMPEGLKIDTIQVNNGGFLMRVRPNSRTSIRPQRRRMSHVKVILTPGESHGS